MQASPPPPPRPGPTQADAAALTLRPQLTLGPLLYYWPREQVMRFYADLADAPVDGVYLGETVCSRRHELRSQDWLDLAAMLRAAGKQVWLSTPVLVESRTEVALLRRWVENGQAGIEANDLGAVAACEAAHLPFVGGPHLNIYNAHTLRELAAVGLQRWVPPLELSAQGLAQVLADAPAGVATEVFAWGRMPLAFSARCFTARHTSAPKDDCGFACLAHPDGLSLRTREGEAFLVLNGIQTQSARVCNLWPQLPALRALGVRALRISPQAQHMPELIAAAAAALHACANPANPAPSPATDWAALAVEATCDGYWRGLPGMTAPLTQDHAPAL